jgi:hypothetical protein
VGVVAVLTKPVAGSISIATSGPWCSSCCPSMPPSPLTTATPLLLLLLLLLPHLPGTWRRCHGA